MQRKHPVHCFVAVCNVTMCKYPFSFRDTNRGRKRMRLTILRWNYSVSHHERSTRYGECSVDRRRGSNAIKHELERIVGILQESVTF